MIFALWVRTWYSSTGSHALLGQVLSSLSSFGPYMWAPVVNNLVSCWVLGVFIVLTARPPAKLRRIILGMTKIALLAGSTTLRIAVPGADIDFLCSAWASS